MSQLFKGCSVVLSLVTVLILWYRYHKKSVADRVLKLLLQEGECASIHLIRVSNDSLGGLLQTVLRQLVSDELVTTRQVLSIMVSGKDRRWRSMYTLTEKGAAFARSLTNKNPISTKEVGSC